jgi:hypothetical protein
MVAVRDADHAVVLRDEHGYCAHPHLVRSGGELVLVCNWAPRRDFVLHPPEDPLYLNLLLRSGDDGRSWSAPSVAPAYGWNGVECAGLTDLGQGRLLLNQWRFDWLTLDAARARADQTGIVYPGALLGSRLASAEHDAVAVEVAAADRLMPWARAPGRGWVHRSADAGRTWTAGTVLDTAPFAGAYGMRGGVMLPGGTLVLPMCDVPAYRQVFVLRSMDAGASWSPPIEAASRRGRPFEEPAPLLLPSGRILLLLRENASRSLWSTHSDDGGLSWAEPVPTGIDGYPCHLTALTDGRVLCTYGFRRPPFAIRCVLSADQGATWTTGDPLEIRSDLPSRDLGYPCTVTAGAELLTVYYGRDAAGLTCILATRWRLPDQA